MYSFIMNQIHGENPVIDGRRSIIMHLNDDPFDNRSTNLKFGTYGENGKRAQKPMEKFSPIVIYEKKLDI